MLTAAVLGTTKLAYTTLLNWYKTLHNDDTYYTTGRRNAMAMTQHTQYKDIVKREP